jgi:hypothetical protein
VGGQDRLDVAQAQAEAGMQPHRVRDDLGCEAEAAVKVGRRRHARHDAIAECSANLTTPLYRLAWRLAADHAPAAATSGRPIP